MVYYSESIEAIPWTTLLPNINQIPTFTPPTFKVALHNPTLDLSANHWHNYIQLPSTIQIIGKVVNGFARGGSMLGIPTANVEITASLESLI